MKGEISKIKSYLEFMRRELFTRIFEVSKCLEESILNGKLRQENV